MPKTLTVRKKVNITFYETVNFYKQNTRSILFGLTGRGVENNITQ